MQYGDPGLDWTEWLQGDDGTFDEQYKLNALREYIAATARQFAGHVSGLSAEWMNKKLRSLGITDLIPGDGTYVLEVPVNVEPLQMTVYAADRAAALRQFADRLPGRHTFNQVEMITDPTFVSGPEDPTPGDIDPDAPTTVDGTLIKLREIILLGHVAGPKYCRDGANEVLAEYGLPPVPPIKEFLLTRPAFATFTTKVRAYDEASALKVGEWRWDDGRSAYEVSDANPADTISVTTAADA